MPSKWLPLPDERGRWEVEVTRALGEGGFGAVYRGKDRRDSPARECAAKKVGLKSEGEKRTFELEAEVLTKVMGHHAIIELLGEERLSEHGWLFLELATGGELFDRLIDSGSLTEVAARRYTKGVASALQHCYSKGVIHRDVKLENVMLCAEDPSAVRLIDFGLAVCLPLGADGAVRDTSLTDNAGTAAYRAPEVGCKEGYSPLKIDVWALGIVLFSLVSGFFPLKEAKPEDWRFARLEKDQAGGMGACDSIYRMYKRTCPFSPPLKTLLDGMLTIDVASRLSVDEVVGSEWLSMPLRESESEHVYRGLDGEDVMMVDIPDDAIMVTRQPAQR